MTKLPSDRLKGYIGLATKHGFKVENFVTGKKHLKVDITSKSGVTFTTTLPNTPSDRRGPFAWLRQIKRTERELQEKQVPKETKLSTLEQKSAETLQITRDTLVRMSRNPDLLILQYQQYAENGNKHAYYINTSRNAGPPNNEAFRKSVFDYMLEMGLIQQADRIGERKTVFSLTDRGLSQAGILKRQESQQMLQDIANSKPWLPKQEKEEPAPEAPAPEEPEVPPQAVVVPLETLSDSDIPETLKKYIGPLLELDEETIKLCLFYGLQSIRDDTENQIKKQTEHLQRKITMLDGVMEKLDLA